MKRSSQVALLLLGVTSAGVTADSMMPRRECQPPQPGSGVPAAQVQGATAAECSPRGSSSSSSWTRSYSSSSSDWSLSRSPKRDAIRTSTVSTQRGVSSSSSTSVARGGFGSTGHSSSSSGS